MQTVMNAVRRRMMVGLMAMLALAAAAVPAFAQDQPKVEVGASLANLTVGLGDNDFTTFGVPSSLSSFMTPGVYVSFFATPKIAIEPQVGLIVISGGGETDHLLNVAGQVSYFTRGAGASSPFIFGTVGLVNASDEDSVTSFGGGAGYRFRVGDSLTLRTDGRFTHFSDGGGNTLSLTLSIGGLFGRK